MSGVISPAAGFPGLGQVIMSLSQTRTRLDTLTEQASSGLIANTFAGLDGAGLNGNAAAALSLGPQIDNLQAAQNNIDAASGPAQVTQTAMTQIQSIMANLLAQIPALSGVNSAGIDTIAANARSALTQVADLLNSQYGSTYVFAGQDSTNPPVPNADQITSSGFFLQISAAVSSLSANGAAATIATTLTVASSNAASTSPFSSFLSQPSSALTPPSVSTGNGQSQTIGLLASANTDAVSTGSSTTGSYMRDLLRALATLGSMSSSQANDPNFGALVEDTRASLSDATTAMSTDVGILGEKQANLTSTKTTLSDTIVILTSQQSSAQNVDMAATLSNLTLTQTQLQASYQLIGTLSSLSLAKFLPAA